MEKEKEKKYFRVKENTAYDLPLEFSDYDKAEFLILPVPYEETTTYMSGTRCGPEAIIKASQFVELYDEEFNCEPFKVGIHTMPYFRGGGARGGEFFHKLENLIYKKASEGKRLITIGGEHSISIAPIRAYKRIYPKLTVIQFDAHADLRDSYEDSPDNHACVMKRVYDEGCEIIQIGIRSISKEEVDFSLGNEKVRRTYAFEVSKDISRVLGRLKRDLAGACDIYITFDVDVFDPSVFPSTGTPEPGGLNWIEVLRLLEICIKEKNLVGFDVVECMPIKGLHYSEFTAAKLIYKILAMFSIFP